MLRVLLIIVVLPSGILSARTFFWVSTVAVAHLLKWDTPTRSNDVREFDAADALFAREVLNPAMCPAKGFAMPVASAKCWLCGRLAPDTDFLVGDLGDKGRAERVERVEISYSAVVMDCVPGIAGSARVKVKLVCECERMMYEVGTIHLKQERVWHLLNTKVHFRARKTSVIG